jgi:beta-glucosidase
VDQFGGEYCPELDVDLVRGGAVTHDRLDASAARILREKFALGLFDRRRVDVDRVPELVGQPRDVATGREMQTRSLTVLVDRIGLPLAPGTAVRLDGLEPIAFDGIATVVGPEQAQVTIARVEAPFEPRAGGFEALFHAGPLELDDGAAAALSAKLATRPTILVVDLDRPAILRPHVEADVLIAAFGASDQAIVDGLLAGNRCRDGSPSTCPPAKPTSRRAAPMSPSTPNRPFSKRGFRATG